MSGLNAKKAGLGTFPIYCLLHWCCDCCVLSAYNRGKYEEKSGGANSGLLLNCCIHW